MKLHIGTMGWRYNFWRKNFYPENLSPKEFLAHYGTRFNTVEINSTFYRIPRKQSVINWKQQTPPDFLFSLKFPRMITHIKMLKHCQKETSVFLERVELLQEELGPLLIQFPPSFGNENIPILGEFLGNLPKTHRYVVEIRNKKLLNEKVYSILRDKNVILAWVDSSYIPLIKEITSDFIYIRWEGDRRQVAGNLGRIEIDKTPQIKMWADELEHLDGQIEVFGYFSKYYSGHPPTDAQELLRLIKT